MATRKDAGLTKPSSPLRAVIVPLDEWLRNSFFRAWGKHQGRQGVILRAPGIYAHNRLPIDRLKAGTPRFYTKMMMLLPTTIHADYLARLAWLASF